MKKSYVLIIISFLMWAMAFSVSYAKTKSLSPSILDNKAYILLHPYFSGKTWKTAAENIDFELPDTLKTNPAMIPNSFDIGKNIDSTVAVFTTAQGDLFLMPAYFTAYFGGCLSGGLNFGTPQKIPLSGMSITGASPVYLVKDSLSLRDSVRIVVGTSSPPLCAATIKLSTGSIVKIDTLQMQSPGSVVRIQGDFSNTAKRDTGIWVLGTNGMIRSFSFNGNAWGTEKKWDISGLSDTVRCIGGIYAGTNTGNIYRKTASQTFVIEYSGSGKAVNAIYPQGAVGSQGYFVEHVNTSWRPHTLGSSSYCYGNFIKTPGGFGIELIDSKWKYQTYTYRDISSKILLTIPTDRFTYVNNGTWHASTPDTGVTIYILDPDSNFKDLSMSLKHKLQETILDSVGSNVLSSIPDSETCQTGRIRLTDGIVNIRFNSNAIMIKANAELGTQKIDCGTCYWKKYDFLINKQWELLDSVIIKAGNDVLKIQNNFSAVTTVSSPKFMPINAITVCCKTSGNHLTLHISIPNLKYLSVFDISGRKIFSAPVSGESNVTIPRIMSHGLVFIELAYKDGTSRKIALPSVF